MNLTFCQPSGCPRLNRNGSDFMRVDGLYYMPKNERASMAAKPTSAAIHFTDSGRIVEYTPDLRQRSVGQVFGTGLIVCRAHNLKAGVRRPATLGDISRALVCYSEFGRAENSGN